MNLLFDKMKMHTLTSEKNAWKYDIMDDTNPLDSWFVLPDQ